MKFDINNKLFLKILSALVALILWFAITYTEDPVISQYLNDIPVVFEGESTLADSGLAIVNKEELPALSAVIQGKRSSVISAMGTVVASCDVSGIETAGENNAQLKYVYPSAAITMAKIKTKEITLETEKIIARNIPIKITVKNAEKNGEYIVHPKCDTDKIRIRGAETDVYRISYADVVVDVAQMTKNNTQEYIFSLCDKDGNTVLEDNIISKSSRTVSIENFVYKKATLPIKVKLSDELSKTHSLTVKGITPEKIDVGIVEDLGVTELTAEVTEVLEDTEYTLEITVPDGIYLPKDKETVKAVCDIIPLETQEKEVKIELLNKQDAKIEIAPEKIKVRFRYPKGMEQDIKLKATVDVKDLENDAQVPVKIEAPEKVEIIGDYSVNVYIK